MGEIEGMIKVLLVDDEELALEHLASITNWQAYGFEIIGRAGNAEMAMKLFRKEQPELIISDVRMPGTNGLEFISEIRQISQTVHVLFLSGYENFDYARKAVRLGTDDYILKSDLSEELLLSRLLPLGQKINREIERRKYTLSSILSDLFHEVNDEKYYQKILSEAEFIKVLRRYYYVVFSIRRVPDFVRELLSDYADDCFAEESRLEQAIVRETANYGLLLRACFNINKRTRLAVIEMKEETSSVQEVTDRLKYYATAVCDTKPNDRYYAHYDCRRKSIIDFKETWNKTKVTVTDAGLQKAGYVGELRETETFTENGKQETWSAEHVVEELTDGNVSSGQSCLEQIRLAAEKRDSLSYLWYSKIMLTALTKFDGKRVDSVTKMHFSLYENSQEQKLYTADGMLTFLREKISLIQRIGKPERASGYSDNIAKAIQCIQEKYGDAKMSVSYVAENVGLSETWLSTKFKDEIGIGVAEYINNVRISHAKKLLTNPNVMVYEVSEQCGFASSQYFSKVFKSLVGMTPNRYQKEYK